MVLFNSLETENKNTNPATEKVNQKNQYASLKKIAGK